MGMMLRKWILDSIIKSQPVNKPVVQLIRIDSLPDDSQLHGHFKLACISDKEKFIRAVFTKDSLAQLEEKGSTLEDIRGALIGLQDYAVIASIGTDRRFSEYFIEVHNFNLIGGERNMAIPTVTNINLDEKVQSKLAHLWRERHLDDRADNYRQHSALTVYSQMEDSPQLSQDELSMLLVAMSGQSQVDSIEAISSSQVFELENISGWAKPDKAPQLTEPVSTQETYYATPLIGETAISRNDASSCGTVDSDVAFTTPPERLTSPNGQPQGREIQQMDDDEEEPLDLTTIQPHSSTFLHDKEATQHAMSVIQASPQEVNDMSQVLEQAVNSAAKVILLSNSLSFLTANINEVEVTTTTPTDMDSCTEISSSQVKDLNAVWTNEQPSQLAIPNRAAAKQPCSIGSNSSDGILLASDTPSNRHNCRDNVVNSTGCPGLNTATSSRWQVEDQPRGKQVNDQVQQQVTKGNNSIDKGKGGTTKQVGEHFNTANGPTCGDGIMDDEISISSSQRDELDKQWVVEDENNINSVISSPETLEDLHPFQLASLTDPSKKMATDVTDVHQDVMEDEPGPSGVSVMDTGSDVILNQEAKRQGLVVDGMNGDDAFDIHLLSQAEAVTSPTVAKMQTSLLSTAAITRLLDVSNKVPPSNDAVTIHQSSAMATNTRLTPSRTMSSNHNRAWRESSTCHILHKECVFITHDDVRRSNDITKSKECLHSQPSHCFKPLTSEEDIDEFINSYWNIQQLHTFSY